MVAVIKPPDHGDLDQRAGRRRRGERGHQPGHE